VPIEALFPLGKFVHPPISAEAKGSLIKRPYFWQSIKNEIEAV
jgi:hypothetical protein